MNKRAITPKNTPSKRSICREEFPRTYPQRNFKEEYFISGWFHRNFAKNPSEDVFPLDVLFRGFLQAEFVRRFFFALCTFCNNSSKMNFNRDCPRNHLRNYSRYTIGISSCAEIPPLWPLLEVFPVPIYQDIHSGMISRILQAGSPIWSNHNSGRCVYRDSFCNFFFDTSTNSLLEILLRIPLPIF